jgi:hypothetical protein
MNKNSIEIEESPWQSLYIVGGMAALIIVVVALIEIIITFLPEGNAPQETVSNWFSLFENNWFLGLRNLGLLNIIIMVSGIPAFLALYGVHRHINQAYAMLAMIIFFIGVGVFLATNRALPMLELSHQYAAATTDAQRAMLAAAGQAMLAVGKSHSPGTWLGFFLSEVAGVIISVVMLKGKIFSEATAYVGMVGFSCLLVFDIVSSFALALADAAIVLAMMGGLLSMAWYILLARRLFQLGRNVSKNRNNSAVEQDDGT